LELAMTNGPLVTYLNDHLAASVGALELMDHLAKVAPTPAARDFFVTLHGEVVEDREALRSLLARLGATESPLRKDSAWFTEKLGEAKLRLDAPPGDMLHQLEALEALTLALHGKLTLWVTLRALADRVMELAAVDLARLEGRGREHLSLAESRRLAAARAAFSTA
jgi:hypothetical protein